MKQKDYDCNDDDGGGNADVAPVPHKSNGLCFKRGNNYVVNDRDVLDTKVR
jgi:hypothetical protein